MKLDPVGLPSRGRWALLYLAFVVYGSLVPLELRALGWDQALQQFAAIPYLQLDAERRADWVANAVLYVPLGGLLAAHWLAAGWRKPLALTLAWSVCAGVALAVEFTQQWFPPRTVSLNDLLAEAIGAGLGVALAPALDRWLLGLRAALAQRGARWLTLLLGAYALAHLLLSFFPYDLVLSAAELDDKLRGGSWAWTVVVAEQGRVISLLQWLVDGCLCLPIGWWLARRSPAMRTQRGWWLGIGLGLLIELGQFFLVSGVSQGASVLSRGLGVAAGVRWLTAWAERPPAWWRAHVRTLTLPLVAVWALLLLFANGWLRSPVQGPAAALAVAAELRWLPFYYHYYTSEAVALFSLGMVALMYLPVAVWAWAWGGRPGRWALAVAVLSAVVEASKLLLVGMRPDPSNPLIAAVAVGVASWALALWERAPPGQAAEPKATAAGPASAAARPLPWPGLLLLLAALAWLRFPLAQTVLLVVLGAAALLCWRRPVASLGLVPALLPVLDLAPWSGRLHLDEFDLLMAVVIGVTWMRTASDARRRPFPGALVLGLVLVAVGLSAARSLAIGGAFDAASLAGLWGPLAGVRIAKGAVWAGLYLLLWQRLHAAGDARSSSLSIGMVLGVAATSAVVLWERWNFGVLLDFGATLRVTGLFSAMSKGGAYIECFLALGLCFVLASALRPGLSLRTRGLVLGLLLVGSYALLVTYSRNGYAAFGLGAALVLLASGRQGSGWQTLGRWALAALLALAAVAVPVLLSPFASARLAATGDDLAVRRAHWADAVALRPSDLATQVLGAGLGLYPQWHYWRSYEAVRAGGYRLMQESGDAFLRLAPGAPVYVEQVLGDAPAGVLTLTARLRSPQGAAQLAVTLCEKWTLSSLRCSQASLATAPDAPPGQWSPAQVQISALPQAGGRWMVLPTKLSMVTPAGDAVVDVDALSLRDADGAEWLVNGDFNDGMDRWFFATDVDPPWHIHNLPLALWFDQGALGVLAWTLFLSWGVLRGAQALRLPGHQPAAWAALLAFLVSGTLNTLIDEPRFLFLLLVLTWLAGSQALRWRRL